MEFVWDALKDSLILLPFLLISYMLIELVEFLSAKKVESSRLLTGKLSTLFGASFGLIPQCGFSVVATDLFSQNKLKIGTLIAVYISTSDEAIPLLLMHPDKALALLPLLAIKLVLAIVIGYSIDLIFKRFNEKRLALAPSSLENAPQAAQDAQVHTEHEEHEEHDHDKAHDEAHDEAVHAHHTGCCGHDIELDTRGAKVKQFFLHPLIHTLKIFAFVLVVNLIFGAIIHFVTEERLMSFLSSSKAFAPLIAALIGLIPNCASSVVITQLYTLGGIGFGACMAGLIVNAGIAFVVLFKQNKNQKENFAILGAMLAIGILTGYIIQFIGF